MEGSEPIQQAIDKKSPFKVVTIIMSVIIMMLIGLVFFFYLKSNSSQTTSISGNSEISKINPPIDKTPYANDPTQSSINNAPYITDSYFYVPDWGVKFKLDDSLTDYGYSVEPSSIGASYDNYILGLTAVQKKDLLKNPQGRYYDDIGTCAIITVSKTTQDMSNIGGPKKVVKSGNSSYVIYDYSAHGGCVHKLNIDSVANKLTNILSHPESI